MIALRASSGLGDAIHLRAAVLHLLDRGDRVMIFNRYAQVFADLPIKIRSVAAGDKCKVLRHFAYKLQRPSPTVDNFTAACQRAGIEWPVTLAMRWTVKNEELVDRIMGLATGRKILIFQSPKKPDNEQQELLRPGIEAYNAFVADHHEHFRIRLGHSRFVEDYQEPCELDLLDKTSITEAFDIGTVGDLFFGESCYIPMMGEAMDKRFAIMFTRRALTANDRVANFTPERLFHKKHLGLAVYDES